MKSATRRYAKLLSRDKAIIFYNKIYMELPPKENKGTKTSKYRSSMQLEKGIRYFDDK